MKLPLKPIKKKRLFEEIILAIEDFIQLEAIKPGERLPSENELAEIFQVSKTAVREAMSVLQVNGVIEKRTGAGIFLKELEGKSIAEQLTTNMFQKREIKEIFEFRRGLEVEAAAIAAERATEKDIGKIKQAQVRLTEVHSSGGLGVEEDFMFHYSIVLASHNSIYIDIFDKLSNKLEEGLMLSKFQSSRLPGRFKEAFEEHDHILLAIIEKDSHKAAEAMRYHLVQNEQKIWANIKKTKG